MSNKLDGKVAVVTGGSAGIGLGIAKALAGEGAHVVIAGRRQVELDKAVAEIGHGAMAVQANAANLADIDRLYAAVKAKHGRIDVLMLNAGFYEFKKFGDITEEHFDKTYNMNVKGTLFAFQKALPLLPKGASVVLTGSIAGSIGWCRSACSNTSESAIIRRSATWWRAASSRTASR